MYCYLQINSIFHTMHCDYFNFKYLKLAVHSHRYDKYGRLDIVLTTHIHTLYAHFVTQRFIFN